MTRLSLKIEEGEPGGGRMVKRLNSMEGKDDPAGAGQEKIASESRWVLSGYGRDGEYLIRSDQGRYEIRGA